MQGGAAARRAVLFGVRHARARSRRRRTVLLERGRWKARGERVVLVVDPAEADTVRGIFDAATRWHRGLLAIAQELNARGVPPPDTGAARSRAWLKTTLWAMLHNPIYQGDIVWSRARYRELGKKRGKRAVPEAERVVSRDAVPAIVSREVWAAAQQRGGRRFGVGRPWHRPYLLSGLIECTHCGKHFQAQRQYRGKVPAYYLCGGYVASGRGFCPTPRIPTTYLDEAVLDGIHKRVERVLDPGELRRRLEALLPRAEDHDRTAAALRARRRDVELKIGRLVSALACSMHERTWIWSPPAEEGPQRHVMGRGDDFWATIR